MASDNYTVGGSITVADMQPKERERIDPDEYKPKTRGGKGSRFC